MASPTDTRRIVDLGRNAWKLSSPTDAGVLVDAADYYRAFYQAAQRAQRSILLSGWEFDRDVHLLRGADATPGDEVRLLPFLGELCARRPQLEIYILAWDFHVVFSLEREWMQTLYFEWATHPRLHFRFDDTQAAQGSHHQKFAVIDRTVSFVGGIDLCESRWDDRGHRHHNPLRVTADGEPSKPYHDVQAYLAGAETADLLRDLFADRWARTAGPPLALASCEADAGDPYCPDGALPLGSSVVSFSRTDARAAHETIREVEALLIDAIAAAERLIYIETQYFSSQAICDALISRMRETGRARLEIVVILNPKPEALKEEITIGFRQAQIMTRLEHVAAETSHALGVYGTLCQGDAPDRPSTYIHSKLLVIDDRFLTVGSANLTNRSMGVDTELNASWEATGTADADAQLREHIRAFRVSLLAEHAGLAVAQHAAQLGDVDGLVARLDALTRVDGARLTRHVNATALEKVVLTVIDPATLPFDPAEPEYSRGSDGWEEEHEPSHGWFTTGISALRRKLHGR